MSLRAILAPILVALFVGTTPIAAHAGPNILLIIADDMGMDASRCYSLGGQQAPMPNVEAMCARGMVFDNAYAAPLCSPTRATIITGQYGFRTGVGTAIRRRGRTKGLSADVTSLFDVLATTRYKANLIGKWHLAGAESTLDHPAELGVPDYFGLIRGGMRDYWNWPAVENGKEVRIKGYATTVFTDRAIDWIRAQDGPWFLWLAYNAPHAPFHLPPAHLHGFRHLTDDPDAIDQNPLPYYNAMLQALDTEIGRLMAAMPREVRDNTVVMFIGDNGSPNQVTRGFYGEHRAKGSIFEGGTHVPFVVSGPGIAPGRTGSFVNTTDLFATIAGYAGAQVRTPDSHVFVRSCRDGGAAVSMSTSNTSRIDARDAAGAATVSVGRCGRGGSNWFRWKARSPGSMICPRTRSRPWTCSPMVRRRVRPKPLQTYRRGSPESGGSNRARVDRVSTW